jgi:YggT family protein
MFEILHTIIDTLASVLGSALLLRAYMQRVRVGGRNPISSFVFALTDRIVIPLRRVVPGRAGVDWASLIAALLLALIEVMLVSLLALSLSGGLMFLHPVGVVSSALVLMLRWALYLALFVTILNAVLSWVNPYAPVAPVVDALARPLLAPFRRVVPLIGGVDLSPIALLLVIQILLRVLDLVAMQLPRSF